MNLQVFLCVLCVVLYLLYAYSKYKRSYWKRRNVLQGETHFFFGSIKNTIVGDVPMSSMVSDIYNKAIKEGRKFFGYYKFLAPAFVPVDLELVKCIMQTDFQHFVNRGILVDEDADPLSGNLFNLNDDKWRVMRSKLTAAFTSGKMKMIFQTMVENTISLQTVLNEHAIVNESVEMKDLLARFTTDIIGNVGFGLEVNSINNPDSEFRRQGVRAFKFGLRLKIKILCTMLFPVKLIKLFNISFTPADAEMFFIKLVQDTVNYREKNNVFRKDFLHLLIQLKNFGRVTNIDESQLVDKDGKSVECLTINEMAAQAFVFFLAGFETSATTMTFILIELSQNPEIQDKVRKEIQTVLKKFDGKLTYEAIGEMEYLEKVVSESLRKHPPLSLIPRICTKDYKVPDTDLIIKAGTSVDIPVLSIHRNPEFYPDPEKFDPERFSPENKSARHPFAYLPFGEGPRLCIGLRLGKLQVKVGICAILSKFRVQLNEKTQMPITYLPGIISVAKGGVYLNFESK
ncbi:unnamed protein product [Phyllotreta striolata]|uniref:Cytochrome P450 n=1 Tax=Phyllotreta striolata TaxID=444603 RepID=A0A9N9TRD9_PHYSR|nr:unnamed protein product [Phyllotreta striolata]